MIPAFEQPKTVHALDSAVGYIVTWQSDYRRVLDWWPDLLDSLIQRVTTLYNSLLHRQNSVRSHVFASRFLVAASSGRRFPSSGFPNSPLPQIPDCKSDSSQRLNRSKLHWPQIKRRLHYCCMLLLPWKHACLQSRYLATAVVICLFRGRFLKMVLHATLYNRCKKCPQY
jgi:hypothetical protein